MIDIIKKSIIAGAMTRMKEIIFLIFIAFFTSFFYEIFFTDFAINFEHLIKKTLFSNREILAIHSI